MRVCPMAFLLMTVVTVRASTTNWPGCYGGTACPAGTHGCCDCSQTQANCTATGGSWQENCQSSTDMCAVSNTKPTIYGCYTHPTGWDCSVTESQCTGSSMWSASGGHSGGPNCDQIPTIQSPSPPSPPSPPPAPPRLPPSPPQQCIPGGAPSAGGTLLAKPAAPEDPVNEPCYSHQSCREYIPGTGATSNSGYVCCVAVGTCDNLVSAAERYYEGGCTGVNYHKDHQTANVSSTSNSTNYPSTIEGCVKQGECNLPFLEQIKHWTGTGSQLTVAAVPDAVMDRLLVGATENSVDACRSSNLYPRTPVNATHNAVMSVTVAGEVSDFTTSILQSMETKLAMNMGVATDDVTITAAAGSVVLTITIAYASESKATAGATAMSSAMPDAAAASSMLTTDSMTITATAVTSATVKPVSESSSSGLALGAIVGIAVGCSVAVILVIVVVMFFMMKKKRTPVTPKG